MLASLPQGYRAAVFGAGGGIGAAFVAALNADARCAVIHAGARRESTATSKKVRTFQFDLEEEASIASAAAACSADGPLHLILITTGLLHGSELQPEKTWRALSPASMHKAFAINTIGPALIARHTLGALARNEKSVFAALSARVGSISDNRLGGWHAYRASKAALNMLIRTFAIELAVRNPSAVCVGLHPGTVDTPLSKPFQSGVNAQKLFSPDFAVERLLDVIDTLTPAQTGLLLAWDGVPIPY